MRIKSSTLTEYICISIVFHVLFLMAAFYIRMPSVTTYIHKPVSNKVRVTIRKPPKEIQPEIEESEKSPDAGPIEMEKAEAQQFTAPLIDPSIAKIEKEGISAARKQIKEPIQVSRRKDIPLYKATQKEATTLRQQMPVRETRKRLVDVTVVSDKSWYGAKELRQPVTGNAFFEKSPGITPKREAGYVFAQASDQRQLMASDYTIGLPKRALITDIKKALKYQLLTYTDPRDGQKYFKVVIRVEENVYELPTMAKEIVFLVDCSKSIGEDRLEEFKEGVRYALKHLNPKDRFKVIAFKDHISRLSDESLVNSADNLRKADRFLSDLKATSRTDAYNALAETIELENAIYPSYILLLSDGRPTQGVTDSRKVINQISRKNDGEVSIFAFSGGYNVGHYLLDMIAYKNRGWSRYSSRTHNIRRDMAKMYDEIRDPILLDLRYNVAGVRETDVQPKILPDIFRDAEIALYGRHEDQERLIVRVLGDLSGETKEFVVDSRLDEAEAGDQSIARDWAFHQIYHLIGQLTDDDKERDDELIAEINTLSNKFNIETPYRRFR